MDAKMLYERSIKERLSDMGVKLWAVACQAANLLFELHVPCLDAHLSHVMRKPMFCICENKDADQLRGNRQADQRLCFRYIDSMIPLLSKSEISSL